MVLQKILSKQNRALLRELVVTDFKLRYQGSVLGYAWSLLKPLLMFAVLYVVFVEFLRLGRDIEHFPVYLLLGIVIWNFFTETTGQSLTSIVARGDLIRKIRIPRWIIVVSASVSALINLGLNLIVVGVFLILNGVDITPNILLLPVSLIEVYLFALGLSFFLAAVFVRFRDIGNIWDVIVQIGFYVTPILYPLSMVPNEFFQKLILMNPMAQAIQDARYSAVTQEAVTTWSVVTGWKVFIPLAIIVVALVIGVLYFKKHSIRFAEDL